MKRLVPLFALAAVLSARAEPALVGLHALSFHEHPGYRTATPGLYLQMADGLTVGVVENSEGRTGAYVARTWETADRRWALTAGGITGYRAAPLVPLLVPSMRVALGGNAAVRLAFIPKPPRAGGSAALHLAIEREWK